MAWLKGEPHEGILAPDFNDVIRDNNDALEIALNKEMNFATGGVASLQGILKQGGARMFSQASQPATRVDGSAFASTDLGSMWIDTDNNKIYTLTAIGPVVWTLISTEIIAVLLASARTFAAALSIQMADTTLTLQNTNEEDTSGGRQSRIIVKGEQSGGEVTTVAWLEFSHEGASDDEKGQLKIYLNDGDDSNAPTLAMTIPSTGVTPTMAQSTAPTADAQLVPKKYVDDLITANDRSLSAYTNQDSENNTMLKSHAYKAQTDGHVTCFVSISDNQTIKGYVGLTDNPAGAGDLVQSIEGAVGTGPQSFSFPVAKDEYFEIVTTGGAATIRWKSFGTLSKPVDQD